jgi:hypothetical protein
MMRKAGQKYWLHEHGCHTKLAMQGIEQGCLVGFCVIIQNSLSATLSFFE